MTSAISQTALTVASDYARRFHSAPPDYMATRITGLIRPKYPTPFVRILRKGKRTAWSELYPERNHFIAWMMWFLPDTDYEPKGYRRPSEADFLRTHGPGARAPGYKLL